MQAEIARGALPPGELARPPLARVGAIVEQVAEAVRTLADGEPGSLDVSVALADGRTLAGTVNGVCGDTIRAVSYSRVTPRDRLRAWVRLLALTAARPERPFESVVIGRARAGVRGRGVTVSRLPPLAGDPDSRRQAALEHLAVLLDLYDRGMREPLPFACETSAAYAQAVLAGEDAVAAARGAWETVFRYEKEDRQPEHLLAYGEALPLARLLADASPRRRERAGMGSRGGDQIRPLRPAPVARAARRRGAERPVSLIESFTEFDLCGPLPSGVTVLEASAGTGKTYAIAALAARYVAEGTPLDRLLLITFTRIATGELRDRVRERLVACEQELSSILAGAPDAGADPVVSLLAAGSEEEVSRRRDRLARAVADFDAATIATTHGFCQEVLAELGTIGDLDRETEFVEDVSDVLEETLDDLYVRRFGPRSGGAARFTRAQALQIARAAVDNPMARLEPRDEPDDSTAAMRYRLAKVVIAELEHRKRRLAIMTYDDLLTRLKQILDGPNGPAARERLRARYDVVLVDEFQDTDPIQWQIPRSRVRPAGRDARAGRRSQAGDLRLPRRRRLRLSGGGGDRARARERWRSTGAATSRSSTPSTRCSPTCGSATRRSSTARCERRPPTRRRGCAALRSSAALRVRSRPSLRAVDRADQLRICPGAGRPRARGSGPGGRRGAPARVAGHARCTARRTVSRSARR